MNTFWPSVPTIAILNLTRSLTGSLSSPATLADLYKGNALILSTAPNPVPAV